MQVMDPYPAGIISIESAMTQKVSRAKNKRASHCENIPEEDASISGKIDIINEEFCSDEEPRKPNAIVESIMSPSRKKSRML